MARKKKWPGEAQLVIDEDLEPEERHYTAAVNDHSSSVLAEDQPLCREHTPFGVGGDPVELKL